MNSMAPRTWAEIQKTLIRNNDTQGIKAQTIKCNKILQTGQREHELWGQNWTLEPVLMYSGTLSAK